MKAERWAQIRQIFDAALERAEVDRPAYLRVACARDEELRREVESLLASYSESSDFLSEPISADVTQTIAHRGDETLEYPPGYRVGPYQLEKCIGRGGMGSVWLAERVDGATWVCPIHSRSVPTVGPDSASTRSIPSVWAVCADRSVGRTW